MLYSLGRGISVPQSLLSVVESISVLRVKSFDFTSSLPDGWSDTRSGNATYFDENGDIQTAGTNTARFDYDPVTNEPLGLLIENGATNLLARSNPNTNSWTNISASNVDASEDALGVFDGSTVSSNGAVWHRLTHPNVSVTSATEYVATIFYREGTSGRVRITFQDISTNDESNITGEVGSAAVVSTSAGTIELLEETLLSDGLTYRAIITFVPDFTGNLSLAVGPDSATASENIILLAAQLEEGTSASSYIPTAGTTVTRNRDEVRYNDLDQADWFDQDEGAIIAFARFREWGNYEQGVFGAGPFATSDQDQIAVRSINGSGRIDGQYKVDNVDQTAENSGVPLQLYPWPVGITWKEGEVTTFSSYGMRFMRETGIDNITETIDTMWLGRRQRYFGYANIHITKLIVLKGDATYQQIAGTFHSTDNIGLALGGQSQAEGWSEVEGVYTNGGEVAAITELDTYYPTGKNFLSNMAIGGASLYQRNNSAAYHLENDGTTTGITLANALEVWGAMPSGSIKAMVWQQGATDAAAETATTLKDGWLTVFNKTRAVLGDIPILVLPPGRRSDGASGDDDYDVWRDVIQELADENSFIHLMPNTCVLPLVDETGVGDASHINDAGWSEYAPWVVRYLADLDGETVTGAIEGSTITSVERSSTTVTITLSHPSGITDFTPTTAIEGFVFEDDGTPITINSAVRTDATTITLTLDSVPTGSEQRLKYCYGVAYDIDPTKLVRGDDSNAMPLQSYNETV